MKTRARGYFFVLMMAAAPLFAANVYYVDGVKGHDSYLGNASFPFKTIQTAANKMLAGDSVIVAAGYYPERVYVTKSGTPNLRISYVANGVVKCQGFTIKADQIIVRGFTITSVSSEWNNGYGIFVEGKNCLIENNYVYYNARGGISLRPLSADCVVRNNRCYRNCTQGLEIHGYRHCVENNEIWGTVCHHTPTGLDCGAYADADGIRFFGSGHIFRKNYIHDINYDDPENIGFSPHIDGFETWSNPGFQAASNIVFEKNHIILPIYPQNGIMLQGGFSSITVRNNVFIAARGITSSDGENHHLKIQENTFIGILAHARPYDTWGISLRNVPFALVHNNIFFNQTKWASNLSAEGIDVSHNCIYNADRSVPLGAKYPLDKWGLNPSFVNSAGRDYHLQANSPCKDSGKALRDIVDDFDGNKRPNARIYDIGAYEYYKAKAPSIKVQPKSQRIKYGQTANLSIKAGGTEPLRYQWFTGKKGNKLFPIAGATSSTYRPLALKKQTFYWVRISNAVGSRSSRTAVITAIYPRQR